MRAALRAERVLCADETPVSVIRNAARDGQVKAGRPHVVTVCIPDARLIWYGAAYSRSAEAIRGLGLMGGYGGILVPRRLRRLGIVRHPARRGQQCCQHLSRHLKGITSCTRTDSAGPGTSARSSGQPAPRSRPRSPPGTSTCAGPVRRPARTLRPAVAWGETTNGLRDWHDDNHPGYVLAA
jgi:Transposase IS66 family